MLADFQPDLIKQDMQLLRGIDGHRPRQMIIKSVLQQCREMGIQVIVDGVETLAERDWLWKAGAHLMQGYLFARPALKQILQPDQIAHLRA